MTEATPHRFDDRLRVLLTAFAIIVSVVVKPWTAHLVLAGALVLLVGLSRVRYRTWAFRIAAASPFLLVVGLLIPFSRPGEPVFVVWERAGWVITDAGISMWALVMARGFIAIGWLAFMALAMTPERVAGALVQLRVPATLVTLGWLTYRYLWVLADETATLIRAWTARRIRADRRSDLRVLTQIVGVLFVRALERAERVHCAMQARGFTGGPPAVATSPMRRNDALVAWLLAGIGFALLLVAH